MPQMIQHHDQAIQQPQAIRPQVIAPEPIQQSQALAPPIQSVIHAQARPPQPQTAAHPPSFASTLQHQSASDITVSSLLKLLSNNLSTPNADPLVHQLATQLAQGQLRTEFQNGLSTNVPPTSGVNHVSNGDTRNAMAGSNLILYPDVQAWLKYCDRDYIRGRDNENYEKYAQALIDKRILRLDDVLGLSHEELEAFCVGMQTGTARRILRFADEDVKVLRSGKVMII
jgi:hypothetical protein